MSLIAEKIRAKYGDQDANVYIRLKNDPDFGGEIIENAPALEDPVKAAAQLSDICSGKAAPQDAPRPLRVLFMGLSRAAAIVTPPPGAAAAEGVKTRGLKEAVLQAVELKEQNGVLLSGMRVNPPQWRDRVERVTMLEGIGAATMSFHRLVLAALTYAQRDLASTLRTAVNEVRSLLVSNLDPSAYAQVHDYLYGSAEEGAQRAKENQHARKEIEEKAKSDVTLSVKREAREEAARDLDAMSRELIKRAPDKAP